MASYVLTQECTTQDNYMVEEFCDVCTKETVVVSWAKLFNHAKGVSCKKYDDVGVLEDEVNLKETARLDKLVMVE